MHQLRNNPELQPSLGDDISDALLDQLQDTKERIKQRQDKCFKVAVLHLSGDLMHSAHIQYMNTAKRKLEDKYGRRVKLLVGVEADSRTLQRKNKQNVNSEEERKYMFENLKAVDKAYIEFEGVTGPGENEERPAGILKYLGADIMLSHQEHIDGFSEYLGVYRRYKKATGGQVMVVNYGDEKILGEENVRKKYQASTTNKIRKIFNLYRDNKKYNI